MGTGYGRCWPHRFGRMEDDAVSYSSVLGVVPDRRPIRLLELRNGHGWSPSIWRRLLARHDTSWFNNDAGLTELWRAIEDLPEWQQAPLVLTFDTGVVPYQAFQWAADQLEEFERRLPDEPNYVNHVPAVAALLRSGPEVPFVGVYGTSVSENPFDPWDEEADAHGSGIPLKDMYLLGRHHHYVPEYRNDDWPPKPSDTDETARGPQLPS